MSDEDLEAELEAAFDDDDDDDDGTGALDRENDDLDVEAREDDDAEAETEPGDDGLQLEEPPDDFDPFGEKPARAAAAPRAPAGVAKTGARKRGRHDGDEGTLAPMPVERQPSDREDESSEADSEVGYMWGMNITTGEAIDDASTKTTSKKPMVQLRYGTYGGLELGRSEVRRIKAEEKGKLLAARKLVLVLDLDHTLLNSAVYHELTPEMMRGLAEIHDGEWRAYDGQASGGGGGGASAAASTEEEGGGSGSAGAAAAADGKELVLEEPPDDYDPFGDGDGDGDGDGVDGDAASTAAAASASAPAARLPRPLLHHLPHIAMWTKLRPAIHAFLRGAAEGYELYVYTMGAHRMVEVAVLARP